MKKFRGCLDALIDEFDDDADTAEEVRRLFFDVLDMKCSRKKKFKVCEKFDEWFQGCEQGEDVYIMSATDVKY